MTPADEPKNDEIKRVIEEAEEGPHGRIDDPGAPLETGPIEMGRVDGGPTGERESGFRQSESGNRIVVIAAAAVVVIVLVVLIGFVF